METSVENNESTRVTTTTTTHDEQQQQQQTNETLSKMQDDLVQDDSVTSTTAAIIKSAHLDESLTSSPPSSPTTTSSATTDSTTTLTSSRTIADSITQSTFMITDSQIMGASTTSSITTTNGFGGGAHHSEASSPRLPENGNDDNKQDDMDTNSQSMIVLPSTSSTTDGMSISMPPNDEDTEIAPQNIEESVNVKSKDEEDEEEKNRPELVEQVSSTSDDVDKLVNDYEIPNFDKSIEAELGAKAEQIKTELDEKTPTNEGSEEAAAAAAKKEERKIENETFQEILGNSSLLKKITQYGEENLPEFSRRPLSGQMVTIAYEAYLKDSLKLVDHNDNLSFILGDGDVISGLDMVVSLMDKNEKCEMIVESRHAYGSLGKQPDIPPNATLLYKIHLKEFTDVTDLNLMSPLERLSLADAKKLRGNYHYNRQDFHLAIMSYKKGLNYFNEENLRGDELDEDSKKFGEMSQALSMNLALSYYKMGECRDALNALDQVISIKSNHVKALYIKGKIQAQLGETEEAIKTLNLSLQYEPENADVKKELAKAQAKHKIQYENEKKMYKKMISGVGKENSGSASSSTSLSPSRLNNSSNKKNKDSSSVLSYVATGLVIAVASVGIAWLARYRNLI